MMKKIILMYFILWLSSGGVSQAATILKREKDLKSGVGYTVVLDDHSVTMAFDFSGPMRLMQLVRNGFSVYINENGKKREDMGLIISGLQPPKPHVNINPDGNPNNPQHSKSMTPEEVVFEQAYWKNGSDSTLLNLFASDSGFKIYFDCTDGKYRCVVVVPVEAINPVGIRKPQKMMIGLLSANTISGLPAGTPSKRSDTEGESGFGGMEGGSGGGPGGAPGGGMGRSGGGGMGRSGGGPGGRPPGGMPGAADGQSQAVSNEIKLWFKCK